MWQPPNPYTKKFKPPFGTPLDFNSQFVKGLVGCWKFDNSYKHNTLKDGQHYIPNLTGINADAVFQSDNPTPNTYYPYFFKDPMEGQTVYSGSGSDFGGEGSYDSYITIPDSILTAINGGKAATLLIRLKLRTVAVGENRFTSLTGNGAVATHYPYIDNNVYCNIFKASSRDSATFWSGITAGQWHNFVVVASPGRYEVWQDGNLTINGTPEATISVDTTGAKRGALFGGGNTSGTATLVFYDGAISLAGIWNRALSAGEVKQLALNPWQMFQPTTWWAGIQTGGGPTFIAKQEKPILQAVHRASTY